MKKKIECAINERNFLLLIGNKLYNFINILSYSINIKLIFKISAVLVDGLSDLSRPLREQHQFYGAQTCTYIRLIIF